MAGRAGGGWRIETPHSAAPLIVDDPGAALEAGQAVAVAVRPEKMALHRESPPPGTPNLLAGAVWDIGYLGDWTVYRVKLDTGGIVRASRANRSRHVESPIDWEERVYLSFAPDAAVILSE